MFIHFTGIIYSHFRNLYFDSNHQFNVPLVKSLATRLGRGLESGSEFRTSTQAAKLSSEGEEFD